MQPSLSAQAGQVTGPPVTFSTVRYQTVSVLADLSMRMETAAILVLRKVLNPDIPSHQVSCSTKCVAWFTCCCTRQGHSDCASVELAVLCTVAFGNCSIVSSLLECQQRL